MALLSSLHDAVGGGCVAIKKPYLRVDPKQDLGQLWWQNKAPNVILVSLLSGAASGYLWELAILESWKPTGLLVWNLATPAAVTGQPPTRYRPAGQAHCRLAAGWEPQ